jgi:uncharacterized membrane protein YphA (DoxX/SURF4 family)
MPQSSDRLARVVAVFLGAVFVLAGASKVAQLGEAVSLFDAFGLPRWSMFVVGAVELAAGVLVLINRTRTWGALLICLTMGGAGLAHAATAIELEGLVLNFAFFGVGTWLVLRAPPKFLTPDWEHDPHGHDSIPH